MACRSGSLAKRPKASRDAKAIRVELILLAAPGPGRRALLDFGILPRSPAHHAAIAIAVDPSRAVGCGMPRMMPAGQFECVVTPGTTYVLICREHYLFLPE